MVDTFQDQDRIGEGPGETRENTGEDRLAEMAAERIDDRSGTHPGSQTTFTRDELGLRHVRAARKIIGETDSQDGE